MSSMAILFSKESSPDSRDCNSDCKVAKDVSILTLALAVKFLVSFLRLVSTISRRFGLVTTNLSVISSSLEGSFDSRIAIVLLRVFALLDVFQEGIREWIAWSSSSRWILVSIIESSSLLSVDSSMALIMVVLMEFAANLWYTGSWCRPAGHLKVPSPWTV